MAYRVNGGRQWQDEWEEADPWLRTPEPENPKAAPPGLPAPPPALATVGAPAFYLPDWARQMGEDITAWLAPEVDMFGADRNGRGFMQALEPLASIQVGNGDSQSETPVDWQGLAAYLSGKRVYQAADKNTWWRWLQDTDGNIISSPEFLTYDGDRAFGIAAALAGGLVAGNVGGAFSGASSAADSMTAYLTTGAGEGSTFGGALAGGGASGAVGSGSLAAALQGTQAALINAAQQGTVSGVLTEARGGDFADGFVSGFGAGAVGQGVGLLGIPEAVGVTWQPAAGVINSGLSGGVLADLNGGRFNDGFEAGAVGAAITQALQGVIAAVSSWTEPLIPVLSTGQIG